MDSKFQENGETLFFGHRTSSQTGQSFLTKGKSIEMGGKSRSDGIYNTTNIGEPSPASDVTGKPWNQDDCKIPGCSDSSFQESHQTPVLSRRAEMFVTDKQDDKNMLMVSPHSLTKCPSCQMIIPYSLVELHSQTCNGNMAKHTVNFLQGNLKKCQYCRSLFPNSSIEEHSKVCSRRKVHQCPECKKVFRIRSKLLVHKQSHSSERLHPCKICGKPFKFKSGLSRHVKQQHPHAKTGEIKSSLCWELQELGYTSIQDDEKNCKSDEIDKSLRKPHFRAEDLRMPTRCVKKKLLKAVVNNQKFSDDYEIALNEGNNVVRQVTDKEQPNLQISREEGCVTLPDEEVNSQKEDECRKSAKESEHCEQKIADENFKDCFEIEGEKSNKSNCTELEVTMSELNVEANPRQSEVSDELCPVVITQKCSETKVFKCPECPKLFEKPSSLIIHRRTHSDLKLFTCEICQQLFKYKGSLKRHVKEQHYGLGRKSCSMVTDGHQTIDFDDISSVVSSRLGNGGMSLVNTSDSDGEVYKHWKEQFSDGGRKSLEIAVNKQSKPDNFVSLTKVNLIKSSGDESEAGRCFKQDNVSHDILSKVVAKKDENKPHHSPLENFEFDNNGRHNECFGSKEINHGGETLNEKENNPSIVHERQEDGKISAVSNESCPENIGNGSGRNFEVLEHFKRKESTMFERHGNGNNCSSDNETRFENFGRSNAQSAKGNETTKSRENMFKVDELLQEEDNYPSMIFVKRQEDSQSLYSQNELSLKNDDGNTDETSANKAFPYNFEENNSEQKEISASMVFNQRQGDAKSLSFQDEVDHSTGKQVTETCKSGESPRGELETLKQGDCSIERDEGTSVQDCFEISGDHFEEEENIFEVNSRPYEASNECFTNLVPVNRQKFGDESTYQCEECEKVFSKQSSLANHKLTHTSDMPFTCEICSKCFKYKGSLARHVKEQHYGLGRKMAVDDSQGNDGRCLQEIGYTHREVQNFESIVKAIDNNDSDPQKNFDQNMIFDDRQIGSSKKESHLDNSRSTLNENEKNFMQRTSHPIKVFDERQVNGNCYSKEGHGLQKGINDSQEISNENDDHGKKAFYPRLVFSERSGNTKSYSSVEKVGNFKWCSNQIDDNDSTFEESGFHPSTVFDERLQKKNSYSSVEKVNNRGSIVNENNSNGGNLTDENFEKSNVKVKETSLDSRGEDVEGNCQTIALKKKEHYLVENNNGENSFEDSTKKTRPDGQTSLAVPNIFDTWDFEGSPSDITCKICGKCFKYKGSLTRHIKEQHYGLGRRSFRVLLHESQADEGVCSRTEDTVPNRVGNHKTIEFKDRDNKGRSVPDVKVVKGKADESNAQEKLDLHNRTGGAEVIMNEIDYKDGSFRDKMVETQQSYEHTESNKQEEGMEDLNTAQSNSEEIFDKVDEKERNLDTTCDNFNCKRTLQVLEDVPKEEKTLNCEQANRDICVEFQEISSVTFKCKMCRKHFKYKFSLSRHILEHHYGLGRRCFRSCFSPAKAALPNTFNSCEASLDEHALNEKRSQTLEEKQSGENRKRSLRRKTLQNRVDFEQVVKDVDSGSFEEKNFEMKETREDNHDPLETGTKVAQSRSDLAHNLHEQRQLNSKKNVVFDVSDDNLEKASEENRTGRSTVKCKGADLFKCDECPKIFPSRSVLKKHKRIHSDAMAYSCEICQQPFKYKGSVNRHVKEQHYGLGRKGFRRFDELPGNNTDGFSLRKLGTICKNENVEEEERHKTTAKRLNLTKIFDSAQSTDTAMSKERTCSIQENTTFDKNGESTFESVSQNMEQKGKTLHSSLGKVGNNEQESFEVDDETKKDTSKVYQRKVSKKRKVHRCMNCPKIFWTISDLREHTYKHTDERSFACKLCGKAFKFRSGLVRHNRKEHKKNGRSQNVWSDGKSCDIADEACEQDRGNFESSSPSKKIRPNKNVRDGGKEDLKERYGLAENFSSFDNEESALGGKMDSSDFVKDGETEDDGLEASREEEARNAKRRFNLMKVCPSLKKGDSFCNTANEGTSVENVLQNFPFKRKPCLYNCNKCDAVFQQLCDFLTHQRIHKRTN